MSLVGQFLGIINPLEPVWVSLKTGDTIKGLMVDRTRDFLVLRAARVGSIRPQDNAQLWTKAIGDVVIPMENVEYYQMAVPIDSIE